MQWKESSDLRSYFKNLIIFLIFNLILCYLGLSQSPAWEQGEKTYSISLEKVAEEEPKPGTYSMNGMIIETQVHKVKKDEYLWKILRERGLLKKRSLPDILRAIKRLNPSIKNINRLYPGQKLILPIKIDYMREPQKGFLEAVKGIPKELEGLEIELLLVRPGDSVIKLIKSRYHIPDRIIHNEYLDIVKKINPGIKNLNILYPGQRIRLPVYPQDKLAGIKKKMPFPSISGSKILSDELGKIFTLMGAEWINSGDNYIPLKSGGQIKLKAEFYPILSLPTGLRVIVDLNNTLPERMAEIIMANWGDTYRVARVKGCDLREAMERIFERCDFEKIHKPGDPLEIGGSITFKINADWIIEPAPESDIKENPAVVITFIKDPSERTPPGIVKLLYKYGVKVIDYPQFENMPPAPKYETDVINITGGKSQIVESTLEMAGLKFTKGKELSIYKTNKEDISLIINADYVIKKGGKEAIIDLTGLGKELKEIIRQKNIPFLALSSDTSSLRVLKKLLTFIGIKAKEGVHTFRVCRRPDNKNIFVKLNGLVFKDKNGQPIFASSTEIPDAIVELLAKRSFKIIHISPAPPSV